MPPDAVMSAAQVMLPVTASVEESVAAPVTASVEDSVAAPVTPSVPAAVRFLAAQSTVDLLELPACHKANDWLPLWYTGEPDDAKPR